MMVLLSADIIVSTTIQDTVGQIAVPVRGLPAVEG